MKNCYQLIPQIVLDLNSISNVSDSLAVIHTNPVKFQILQKKQVLYVSDGHIVIQAIFSCNTQPYKEEYPKPFNKIRSNFYNFQAKHANLFLFNDQDCTDNNQYPSPYEPKFHFQERLSKFDADVARNQFANITQVLMVKQWAIRVVNISNTGYYGVVLEINQYERLKQKFVSSSSLHSVLYEKQISYVLQKLRVNDMRQALKQHQYQNKISLCYYRKNIKISLTNKTMMSNFVMADRNGKFLKVNLKQKKQYVPIGNISGVLRFIRPLTDFQGGRKTMINFNKFRELPELKDKHVQFEVESDNQVISESDSCQEDDNLQKQTDIQINSEEESNNEISSQEDDQILKMIYLKQISKMTLL